jgi:glycosyltransferase involved in cell wall biosynthesis
VIVTAWNRKGFIKEALQSVVNQSLSRDEYEVIVVKNFEDVSTDRIIREQGFINAFCNDPKISSMYLTALDKCSGDIVCPLDDDDVFHPRKLEEIKRLFSGMGGLGYCRNSLIQFQDGSKIPTQNVQGDISTLRVIKNPISYKGSLYLYPFFNNSSISIRTHIIKRYIHYLEKIEMAVDMFLFAAAYMADSTMMFYPRVLTYMRLHEGSATNLGIIGCNDWIYKRSELHRRISKDWGVLETMCKAKEFEIHCALSRRSLYFEHILFTGSRSQILGSLVRLILAEALEGGRGAQSRAWFFLDPSSQLYRGILGFLSPSKSRKLFYKRHLHYMATRLKS